LLQGGDKAHRYRYELDENSIVFDVGGYIGEFAQQISKQFGSEVHVFEPVEKFFDQIDCANVKIHKYNFGLAGTTEDVAIALDEDGSSVHRDQGKKEIIKLVDICDFYSEKTFPEVALIKINIEGGEFPLLKRMIEQGLTKHFRNIQVQFHLDFPNALEERLKIREALAKTHSLEWDFFFIWESWKRSD